jgi:hypothetical protein
MIWFDICQVYIILFLTTLIFISRKPNKSFTNFEEFRGRYKFSFLLRKCQKTLTFPESKFSLFDIHFDSSIPLSKVSDPARNWHVSVYIFSPIAAPLSFQCPIM